jgi:hypothetical protein
LGRSDRIRVRHEVQSPNEPEVRVISIAFCKVEEVLRYHTTYNIIVPH